MEKLFKGAEILVKSLEDLGVKRIFGFSGATILPVIDAIGKSKIDITVNTNEQCCAFAAAGYSRASDQVGVAVVTSGPAITNTLTAVADSNADSIPLLVFAGQVPINKMGTDEFQHINVKRVFAGAAKKVIQVSEHFDFDIEEIVKDAYYFAKSGKPGPVVIDFPFDVQQTEGRYQALPPEMFRHKYENEAHLSPKQCQDFFDMLKKSKKPLLYVGGGLNSAGASQKLREFNKLFEIPSINSLMAKGVLNETLNASMGMLGMYGTPYANTVIQETDLFVAFGVRWDDRVSQKVGENGLAAEIAYIDINAEKVQEVRVTRNPKFSFIGDAEIVLDDLNHYAHSRAISIDIGDWRARTQEMKQQMALAYNKDADVIQQAQVLDTLSNYIRENVKVTTGVGNHQMLAAQYLKMIAPKSFITSGGFGTMGFALPSAVGVHYANPTATIVAIDGDGSLKMNMGELYTIGTNDLPIKVLLLNNRSDGMVRNIQTELYDGQHTATEKNGDVNFAEIAEKCGFKFSRKIDDKNDLKSSIEAFMAAAGPSFLEVITDINESVYPKIPAGKGYSDMIFGDYIQKNPA